MFFSFSFSEEKMATAIEANPPPWALDIDEIDDFSISVSGMGDYHRQHEQRTFEQYLETKLPTVMWVKPEVEEGPIANEICEPSSASAEHEIQDLLRSTGHSGYHSNYKLSRGTTQPLAVDTNGIAIAGLRGKPKYLKEDRFNFISLNNNMPITTAIQTKPIETKPIEIVTTAIDEPEDFYIDRYSSPKIGLPNGHVHQLIGKQISLSDFITVSKPRNSSKKKKQKNTPRIDQSLKSKQKQQTKERVETKWKEDCKENRKSVIELNGPEVINDTSSTIPVDTLMPIDSASLFVPVPPVTEHNLSNASLPVQNSRPENVKRLFVKPFEMYFIEKRKQFLESLEITTNDS